MGKTKQTFSITKQLEAYYYTNRFTMSELEMASDFAAKQQRIYHDKNRNCEENPCGNREQIKNKISN